MAYFVVRFCTFQSVVVINDFCVEPLMVLDKEDQEGKEKHHVDSFTNKYSNANPWVPAEMTSEIKA